MRNLPPELINEIISYLDNRTFNICQSIPIFQVATRNEIIRRKYENKTPTNLAKAGDLEGIKYHMTKGSDISWNVTAEAVKNGHLNVIKYLIEKSIYPSESSLDTAASRGYLNVLKYLYGQCRVRLRCSLNGLRYATANSHLEVVKFLIYQVIPIDQGMAANVLQIATQYSNIEMVRFLYFTLRIHPNTVTMELAAKAQRLDMIKFYSSLGTPISAAVYCASEMGYISLLDYLLIEHSDEIDTDLLIDCLAIAKENNRSLVIGILINFIKFTHNAEL